MKHSSYEYFLKHPESSAGCIGRVSLLQTIGIRDGLSPFAMTFSLATAPSLEYGELRDLSRRNRDLLIHFHDEKGEVVVLGSVLNPVPQCVRDAG